MNGTDIPQSSIAVLIDFENLALGTGRRNRRGHQEPGPLPDVKLILERLVDKGRITAKRAYCDWQRFSDAVTPLHELGIELIEIPDRAFTGKNSADIRLAVDAMEICLTKDHIDTFAILSGDSSSSTRTSRAARAFRTSRPRSRARSRTATSSSLRPSTPSSARATASSWHRASRTR